MGLLLVVAVITVPGWIPAFPKTLSTAGSWLSVAGMFLIAALFSALGIKLMGDRLRGFIPSFAAIFVLSALCQYVSMLPPIKTAGLESVFFLGDSGTTDPQYRRITQMAFPGRQKRILH